MVGKIISLYILLFCYVFAFFIGPISVSLLMALPMYGVAVLKKEYFKANISVLQSRLIKDVLYSWFLLLLIGVIYPIVFLTFDFSFSIIVITQLIHLMAAIPFLAFLKYNNYSRRDVEHCFVGIFVIQTIIQIIVFSSPYLGEIILKFNHFDPEEVVGIGSNVRGKALSAATTYHLSLAYGICFIIYIKEFLSKKASIINVLIGFLIFVGIFFAGRTGFVGCIIGLLGYFLYRERKQRKLRLVLKVVLIIFLILTIISFLLMTYSPDLYDNVTKNVLPYAFEFLDNLDEKGSMETRSTNRLMEMWSSDFNPIELVIGSGNFTEANGSYYMHVDPGILRVSLFAGILGYFMVWLYQIKLFPVNKFKGRTKFYSFLILVYLAFMDLKGLTVGLNKFTFSITLLLSFVYLYLPDISTIKYKDITNN